MLLSFKAFLAVLDAVPGWLYALALALALGAGGVVWVQLQSARVDAANAHGEVSKIKAQDALDTAERNRLALADSQQVARAQFRHAEITTENSNESAKRAAVRDARDRELSADNDRLRNIVEAYAGGDRREGPVDAATCRRDADHAERLGGLLEEALDLSREGEGLIRQRDDEVRRLREQIDADRQAVEDAAK